MRKLGIASALALSATLLLPAAGTQATPADPPDTAPSSQGGGSADALMADLNDVIAAGGSVSDIESLLPAQPITLTVESTQKAAAAATASCTLTPHNAHYSFGAGGAIFKTAVKCTGTGIPTVSVRLNGYLGFAPSPGPSYPATGPIQNRASSTQVQTITVNGPGVIYYTPIAGNGGTGTGSWIRTVTGEIVAPVGGVKTPGSNTKVNWCALYAGPSC